MSKYAKKRIYLGFLLFVIELCLFNIIITILRVPVENHMIIVGLYFMCLFLVEHFNLTPELVWQEILDLIKAHFYYLCVLALLSLSILHWWTLKIIITLPFMFAFEVLFTRVLRRNYNSSAATRIIVMGGQNDLQEFNYLYNGNRYMFINLLSYVNMDGRQVEIQKSNTPMIEFGELGQYIDSHDVEEVWITDSHITPDELKRLNANLKNRVPVIRYKPMMVSLQPYNTTIDTFDDLIMVNMRDSKKRPIELLMKKCIDLLAGFGGSLFLIPLTIILKICFIATGDFKSIFFTQPRIGQNGKTVKIYKYRSMIPNAEQVLEELMAKDPAIREEYLTNKKLENDPRITKVGNFIRKTSIDEFPQFLNILKGDMSLIGPRPYLHREIEDMGEYYDTIILSKPGISGMWQVNGRSNVSFEDRCKLDIYYNDNWSIWLDLIIIIKTIKVVLAREGAK